MTIGIGMANALWSNQAAVSGGGAAWTPASLPGLKLWVENDPTTIFKDAGTTLAVAGTDTIQQWNDKSGNAHHISQATAGSRPAYATASGKTYATFDGSSKTMATSATFAATDGTGQHYLAVSCYFTNNSSTQVIAHLQGTLSTDVSWVFNNSGPATLTTWDNAASSTNDVGNSITAATPTVLIFTITPTAGEVFVDNTTNGATTLTGTRASVAANLFIGATATPGFFTGGRIYGIVQGSGTLSSSDRASLQTYMAALHP